MSKIKFAINETLESVFEEIIGILPSVKTDWEINEPEKKGLPFYSTEINGVEIEVHERKVVFHLNRGGMKSESRIYETFIRKNKPAKINIYQTICKRFADHNDYIFYKRVLRFMNGQITSQKTRNEVNFTEQNNRRKDT